MVIGTTAHAAGLPEWKPWLRACEERTRGVGEYSTKAECENPNGKETKSGKWERFGVSYTNAIGEFYLTTVKEHVINCTGGTADGILTGPKTGIVTFKLIECIRAATGRGLEKANCETVGSAESAIEFTVRSRLVYTKSSAPVEVGMLLLPPTESSPIDVRFKCEGPTTCQNMEVEGEVVGSITPINQPVIPAKEFALSFTNDKGVQMPVEYEEVAGGKAEKHTAMLKMESKGTETFKFEQTGLENREQISFPEEREIQG